MLKSLRWVVLAITGAALAQVPVPRLNTSAHFTPADYPVLGNFELSGLTQTPDGRFWGVSAYGGANSTGYVYRLNPADGQVQRVHDFGFADGVHPRGRLLLAADGWLYGTTESGGTNQADWCYAGKFYNASGCGTLFRIAPDGRFEKLHDFYTEADGWHASPVGGLVQGADGAFYGMAVQAFPAGQPSLFRFRPGVGLQALHLFAADQSEGGWSQAGLLLARDGSLIGTTASAGGGCGTVFRATLDGSFQTLHVFTGAPQGGSGDGCVPDAPPAEGAPGVFYGSTRYGGYQARACRAGGCGTVYRLTATGAYGVLHRFRARPNDGLYPSKGGLVVMPDGSLYGAAAGNPYGDGFGFAPLCTLGGSSTQACGTLYRISPAGRLAVLTRFGTGNGAPGLFPMAPLALGADGNVYGTAFAGGGWGYGTLWRWVLNPATPLVAIDAFSPPAGPPGTTVTLQGWGLAGTTQVTLGDGQAAVPIPFTVLDDRHVVATVPAGARTSPFGLSGPLGTTYSDPSFQVLTTAGAQPPVGAGTTSPRCTAGLATKAASTRCTWLKSPKPTRSAAP